jgi:hypothetical protein
VEMADGTIYEKQSIEIRVINKPYLDRTEDDYFFGGTLFSRQVMVQKILSGPVSFFKFTDRFQFDHFFYQKTGDPQLVYLRYQPYVDKDQVIHKDASYINLISFLFLESKCSEKLKSRLEQLSYAQYKLMPLFAKLNECLGSKAEVHISKDESEKTVRFGFTGGLAMNNYGKAADFPGFRDMKLTGPSHIFGETIGVVIDFPAAKKVKNHGISLEMFYEHVAGKVNFKLNGDPLVLDVNLDRLRFGPSVWFLFNQKKVSPLFEAGVLANAVLNHTATFHASNPALDNTAKLPDGRLDLFAGLGVQAGRLSFRTRYTVHGFGQGAGNSSWYFLVRYLAFGK